ncbi:hypothetical protein ACFE04_002413 [Oxalis oulophora]
MEANNNNNNFNIMDDVAWPPVPRIVQYECESKTPATFVTIQKIKAKYPSRVLLPNITRIVIRDNTHSKFSWLLPGWVVEERTVRSRRKYKNYYNPKARMYTRFKDIKRIYNAAGLSVMALNARGGSLVPGDSDAKSEDDENYFVKIYKHEKSYHSMSKSESFGSRNIIENALLESWGDPPRMPPNQKQRKS